MSRATASGARRVFAIRPAADDIGLRSAEHGDTMPDHSQSAPNGRRRKLTHAERAAIIETRELERRLRRLEADQRHARDGIEQELRRELYGHLPDGWHGAADDDR